MVDHASGSLVAVVDDDEAVLRSLEYLLESADYAVRLFPSGSALLDSGSLAAIDCLISDIDMPGMDGVELLRLVRTQRPALPLIVITGYPETLQRLPPANSGNIRHFMKPFRGPELLAAVVDVLANSAA
jgi:FixJ family two-component response regulator